MSGVRGLRAQPLARLFRPLLRTAPRQFRAAKEKPEAIRGQVVSLHNFAVGDPSLTQLYLGRNQLRGGELLRYRRTVDGYHRGRDEGARGPVLSRRPPGPRLDLANPNPYMPSGLPLAAGAAC